MKTLEDISKKYYAEYARCKDYEEAVFFNSVEDFEAAKRELPGCEMYLFTKKAGQRTWTMGDKAFELFDVADFLYDCNFDAEYFLSKNEVLDNIENFLECLTDDGAEEYEIQRLQNFLKEVEQMEFGENKIAIVYDDYSKIELIDRFSCNYYDEGNSSWYSLGLVRFFE